MGKATGVLKDLSGKIGSLMFSQKKSGKTSVYLAPEVKETPARTKLQMLIQLVWANLGALYSMFNKTLKHGHEDLPDGISDYNQFIADNCKMVRVYLDKTAALNGGCVLAPVLITRGKLPSVFYEPNVSGVMVTDLGLGMLVIDADTTVADFSIAMLTMNEDWEEGDQLTYFYGEQKIDAVTEVPRAKIKGWKVKLDTGDETPLWDLCSELGFTSVSNGSGAYVLGMNQVITDGAAAWIHSREDEEGNLKVSTQRLVVDSSVLASYMGDAAFDKSVQSYGGITNSKKAFLRPDEETNIIGVVHTGGNTGGSGSGSGSGSGTVTVAAPTFSGETQFAETTQVTMTAETGAQIRYTTDGSTPTASSTLYSSPITLSDTTTVKAIAVKDGVSSAVTSRTYTKQAGNAGGEPEGGDDH